MYQSIRSISLTIYLSIPLCIHPFCKSLHHEYRCCEEIQLFRVLAVVALYQFQEEQSGRVGKGFFDLQSKECVGGGAYRLWVDSPLACRSCLSWN